MKKLVFAPAILLLLGSAERGTAPADALCTVRYDRVLRFTYNQATVAKPMPGLSIRGRYSDAGPAFDFFDDDGFLSLMMVLGSWDANGLAARNRTEAVRVDRRDLVMLRDAAAVGRSFFNRIVAYAATRTDLTPDQVLEVEDAKGHAAFWDRLDVQIGNGLAQSPGGPVLVPSGFIATIGDHMERLRPSAARRIASRYQDRAASGAQSQLCEADAPNPLVGRILCDRDFTTGVETARPFCRPGSTIGSPATALNCEATNPHGKPVATRCTNGAGGSRAPVPAG